MRLECPQLPITYAAMATRQTITKERLDAAGSAAVGLALQKVHGKIGTKPKCCDVELICTCHGLVEPADVGINVRAKVLFEWCLSWQGLKISTETIIRADKAMYEGLLAPPKSWTYILIALFVPQAINECGGLPWMREGDAVAECAGLAMADEVDASPEFCILWESGGLRVEHLILVRADDNKFICASTPRSLYDPDRMVKADSQHVWSETSFPKKRLNGRVVRNGLSKILAEQPQAYATALAVAKMKLAMEKDNAQDIAGCILPMNPLAVTFDLVTPMFCLWRVKLGTGRWRSHIRVVSLKQILKDLDAQ